MAADTPPPSIATAKPRGAAPRPTAPAASVAFIADRAEQSGSRRSLRRFSVLAGLLVGMCPAARAASIGDIPDQTINEDGATGALSFAVGGPTPLTITAASSNQTVVPNGNIVISGSGATRTVTLTPAPNQNGPVDITVTVKDNANATASDGFRLTVNPVDDAPSFTKGADQSVDEDSGPVTRGGWATGISAGPNETQNLNFVITGNTRSGMFSVQPAVDAAGTLTFTPAPNKNGVADITLKLHDDGPTANGGANESPTQTFKITVNARPDPPTIAGAVAGSAATPIPDKATGGGEGGGSNAVVVFADVQVDDPDNDPGNPPPATDLVTVTVVIPESAGLLGTFAPAPVIAGGAQTWVFGPKVPAAATADLHTIVFTPLPDRLPVGQKVSFAVSITAVDTPLTAPSPTRTADVFVESKNDDPKLTASASPSSIVDDRDSTPFRLSINDPDAGENFTVTLVPDGASFGTLTLPSNPITGSKTAVEQAVQTIHYRPNSVAGNQLAKFQFTASDGHGGPNGTAGVQLTISGINDPPDIVDVTLDLIRTTDDPNASIVHPFANARITDPDVGQTLTVTLTLDDPSKGTLVPPASNPPALVVTPAAAPDFKVILTGKSAEVTAAIHQVIFRPTPNRVAVGQVETTTLTISVFDGALTRTNTLTKIAVTSVNGAPVVERVGGFPTEPVAVAPQAPIKPFTGIAITDDDPTPLVELTVSLDNRAKGTLTNLGGFTQELSGLYRFTGSPAEATTALQGLVFNVSDTFLFPAGQEGLTTFVIQVVDSVLNQTAKALSIVLKNEARNFLVTKTIDDPAVVGSLRHALSKVQDNDVVTFALGQYPAVIRLTRGVLTLDRHVSLKGPGADKLSISGDADGNGQPDTQLFQVLATVSMDGLTLTQGTGSTGGAVHVARAGADAAPGRLKLSYCAVTDCRASQWGGAIDVDGGGLTMDHCLLRGNSTDASLGLGGGAVSMYTDQPCTIVNTTFSGNIQRSQNGFGGGALYVENATPSALLAVGVTHCTFAENQDAAQKGSAIRSNVFNTQVTVRNAVFSDHTQRNLYVAGGGEILSQGGNLSDDATRTILIQGGLPQSVTLLNSPSDQTSIDPMLLMPLGRNIGPTETYALNTQSPAIGAAPSAEATDQRGVLRDALPDSGAFEGTVTGRLVINEIHFDPAGAESQFIEFYNQRDSETVDLSNFGVWVDGTQRHVFAPGTSVRSGFGIIVANLDISASSFGTPVVMPTAGPLGLGQRGLIELRTPAASGGRPVLTVAYVGLFANSSDPAQNLNLAHNSLTLLPQFGGAAYVPHSLTLPPPGNGTSSPGKDTANTPFGLSNAFPLALGDAAIIGEDDQTRLSVLANDLDSDGLDRLAIIDLSRPLEPTGVAPADPNGADATVMSRLGAGVSIDPRVAGQPLRGTGILFDPRQAFNHLPVGARVTDSFYYSTIDIGTGPIQSYAAAAAATKIVSPGHRLTTGEAISISGSATPAYNGQRVITKIDSDSFTIPVAFVDNPATRGTWQTVNSRIPTSRTEALVTLTILGANDAPTPVADTVATDEETILRILGDPELIASQPAFDTDPLYPAPRKFWTAGVLANDTDPDDDDSTFKTLTMVGVGQARSVVSYAGTPGQAPVTVRATGHHLATGAAVLISGYGGYPSYNGFHTVTVVDADTFTIPVGFVDDAAQKGVWGVLSGDNRLVTTSDKGAQVTLEIRTDRIESNIVYNPQGSDYLNGLAKDELGIDGFYYAVQDSHGAVSWARVTVSVTGVNDTPVPVTDPASLAVLDPLVASGVALKDVLAGSRVLYQIPSTTVTGRADVAVAAGEGTSSSSFVINGIWHTDEATPLAISSSSVLGNDSDVDRTNVLRIQVLASQALSRDGAAVRVSADGTTITYDPSGSARLNALAREEAVIDTFDVTVSDGVVGVTSLVAVLVTGLNDSPTAAAEAYSIPEDRLLVIGPPGLLLNDRDVDQNTSLPDNKKVLVPVADVGTTVFGTHLAVGVANAQGDISSYQGTLGAAPVSVVSPGHSLNSGEEIVIAGSSLAAYNGQHVVTRLDADTFSIPVAFGGVGVALGSWVSVRSTLTYDPRGSVFSTDPGGPTFTLDGLAQGQTYLDTYRYTMFDGSFVFAMDDLFKVAADESAIVLEVMTNDRNLTGVSTGLRIVAIGTPSQRGQAVLAAGASGQDVIVYTPEVNFVGDEVFTYTVEDELGNRDSALVTVRVTIEQLNGNLQANNDAFSVAKGQSPLLEVLANDDIIPATGAVLTITALPSPPTRGTAELQPDGIRYTPNPAAFTKLDVTGIAAATDVIGLAGNHGLSAGDQVVIAPKAGQTLPAVVQPGQSYFVLGSALTATAFKISTTPGGTPVDFTATVGAGILEARAVTLLDHFTYELAGGGTARATALVALSLIDREGTLNIRDDSLSVLGGSRNNSLDVLANDNILPGSGEVLTITSVDDPPHGSAALSADRKTLRYSPDAGFVGSDEFFYRAADGLGGTGSGKVVVLVGNLVINNDFFAVPMDAGPADSGAFLLEVLANDGIVQGAPGALTIVGVAPTNDALGVISFTPGNLQFNPAQGQVGERIFTYTVRDNAGRQADGKVTVVVTGPALRANSDFFTVLVDSADNGLDVLHNDIVIPNVGRALAIVRIGTGADAPNHGGTVAITATNNGLSYTPAPGFTGEESFTYQVTDGDLTDTARVTVVASSGALSPGPDAFTVYKGSLSNRLEVLANDRVLPDGGQILTITGVGIDDTNAQNAPHRGQVVIASDANSLEYTPNPLNTQFPYVETFTYEISDGGSRRAEARVSIEVLDRGGARNMETNDDAFTVLSDSRFNQLAVLANDNIRPADATGWSISAVTAPSQNGTAAANGDLIVYTPAAGFVGTETFTYVVSDGLGGTGSATVTVKVGDVRVSDDRFVVLSDSGASDLDVLANDGVLPDGFPTRPGHPELHGFTLVANQTMLPNHGGTAVVNGTLIRYSPAAGYAGEETFIYWVQDDSGGLFPAAVTIEVQRAGSDRATATLSIHVIGVNDPPVLTGTSVLPITDKQVINPFPGATITEVDNQRAQLVTVRVTYPPSRGTLTGAFAELSPGVLEFTGTGAQATAAIRTLVFDPTDNRIIVPTTEDTIFTVSMDDGFVGQPVIDATTKVRVTAINDPPVLTGTVAGQRVYRYSTIRPFAGVNITEIDDLTLQALTITVSLDNPTKGFLSNLGGFVQQPLNPGAYVLHGTAAQANVAVRGLVFEPTTADRVTPGHPETTTFTVAIDDGFASPVIDSTTTVTALHPLLRKLLPLDGTGADVSEASAGFGTVVAISGSTLGAGAPLRNANGVDSGAVFIYQRDGGGTDAWGQAAVITPSDPAVGDHFGASVALDGDTLVVGAPAANPDGLADAGVVYVFRRNAGNPNAWDQIVKVKAPLADRASGDGFGTSVAVLGDTLLVGVPFANRTEPDAGAVFVFDRNLGGANLWGLKEKLVASGGPNDGRELDFFGISVALDGNTAVIGANGSNRTRDDLGWDLGAAYVFDRPSTAGGWTQTRKLNMFNDPTSTAFDYFGYDVDIEGNTIVVGAYRHDSMVAGQLKTDAGAAFIFDRNTGGANNWGLVRSIPPATPAAFDFFGGSVAVAGDLVLVGAPRQPGSTNPASVAGYVTVYRRDAGGVGAWGLIDTLMPAANDQNDRFGVSTAIDGHTAAIGALADRINGRNATDAGAAYVYQFKFNNIPVLAFPITNQEAFDNLAFSFQVAPMTFGEADQGDSLAYSAALAAGGPIPAASWLHFDPVTATFFGTPSPANHAPLSLIVTATDRDGARLSSNAFSITVVSDPAGVLGGILDVWRRGHFSPATLADPDLEATVWGDQANPDGDAFVNVFEALFGADPNARDPASVLDFEVSLPSATLVYRRSKTFPVEFVHPEWSADFVSWSSASVAQSVRADLGDTEIIAAKATPPIATGKLYLRLRIGP